MQSSCQEKLRTECMSVMCMPDGLHHRTLGLVGAGQVCLVVTWYAIKKCSQCARKLTSLKCVNSRPSMLPGSIVTPTEYRSPKGCSSTYLKPGFAVSTSWCGKKPVRRGFHQVWIGSYSISTIRCVIRNGLIVTIAGRPSYKPLL